MRPWPSMNSAGVPVLAHSPAPAGAVTSMDRASLVISILTLLVTGLIPIVIYWVGRKGERLTNILLSEQRRLLSAQRLDTLAAQAEQMSDPKDLKEILKEAQGLTTGRSLDRVIECYWRNPQVPLRGSVRELDRRGALITAQHLAAKLEGESTLQAMNELHDFVFRVREFGDFSFIAPRITTWIMSRYAENNGPGDIQIRELLKAAPAVVFSALLDPLDIISNSLSVPARVNTLAGVCFAYLDRIDYYPNLDRIDYYPKLDLFDYYPEERLTRKTTERSGGNHDLSRSMAESLGSLLHRGRLRDLAGWDSEGCSINADACAALVVAAAGATSFYDAHLAMRAAENIAGMNISLSTLGTFRDKVEFGRKKFAEYRPELLHRYWPSALENGPEPGMPT
jgi:hypothetical protein